MFNANFTPVCTSIDFKLSFLRHCIIEIDRVSYLFSATSLYLFFLRNNKPVYYQNVEIVWIVEVVGHDDRLLINVLGA